MLPVFVNAFALRLATGVIYYPFSAMRGRGISPRILPYTQPNIKVEGIGHLIVHIMLRMMPLVGLDIIC